MGRNGFISCDLRGDDLVPIRTTTDSFTDLSVEGEDPKPPDPADAEFQQPFLHKGEDKITDMYVSGMVKDELRLGYLRGHLIGGRTDPETGISKLPKKGITYQQHDAGGALLGVLFATKEGKENAISPAKPMREQLLEIAEEEGVQEGLYLPPADPFDDPLPLEDFNLAEGKVSSEVWDLEVGPIIDGSLDQSNVEGIVRATFTKEGPFTRMILKKNGTTIQDNIRHYLLTYQRELLQPTNDP